MNLTQLLRQCMMDLLETEQTVSAETVVALAYSADPTLFEDQSHRLIHAAALRMVKDLLRESSDSGGQGQFRLDGLEFPSTIAVDENKYVRTDKATRVHLAAGRQMRYLNVERAQAKLDTYIASEDLIRPYMTTDEITVGEAFLEYLKAKDIWP